MTRAATLVVLVGLAACSSSSGSGTVDREAARQLFTRVPADTAPGLSGPAADDTGGIWAVAERAGEAYRITLDAALVPTVERVAIKGVPANVDLEGIAVLGNSRFALGTEGHADGIATVLTAELADGALAIGGAIDLPASILGVELRANHGAEGVCGAGDTIVVAIEATGGELDRRWAPLVRITSGTVDRVHRLRLTSRTGKISGLDCKLAADGSITGWAIERHFEVTKILRFTLPPRGEGETEVTPALVLDVGPILNSKLNLEGIAETTDGRVVAVVDNQWKTITGPSELLVFTPAAVK